MKAKITTLIVLLSMLFSPLGVIPVMAQDFDSDESYFETDEYGDYGSGGGDEESFTPREDGFSDATEGGEYAEEAPMGPTFATGADDTRLRLTGDRRMLPLNAAWGAGTGLMIGSWLALTNNSSSRDTQRSIGLGIVLGSLLGVAVGIKSVIVPPSGGGAPALPEEPLGAAGQPQPISLALTDTADLALRYTFNF